MGSRDQAQFQVRWRRESIQTNLLQMTRGGQEGNDDEPRPRKRICLSRLSLDLAFDCRQHVDWFLEPRSPFEISHIQTLRIAHSEEDDADAEALNLLSRTIGSSLKHLEFYVPDSEEIPRLAVQNLHSNINLEFNTNISFLRVTNIDCMEFDVIYSDSFGQALLLRLLSNIDTSNKLEQIELEVVFDTWHYREATIARRLTPQPIKLRADIELTRYQPAGIDAIKKALRAGEKVSTETVPIRAKLFAAVDRLERAIEVIQSTIEDEGGELLVKMRPKAVSDTEVQGLAQLMAKAGQENAEVSGDEDEEEDVL
ncbi:translation initiation factor 2, alpha subunit [Gautieria morchelliformis]|nr:translation initiation factor 2, alpha subunit [Gautieria morchelliformis]